MDLITNTEVPLSLIRIPKHQTVRELFITHVEKWPQGVEREEVELPKEGRDKRRWSLLIKRFF